MRGALRTQYFKRLSYAYVIDRCQLKKLSKLLQDHVGEVSFSVACVGGLFYEFGTVEDLTAYENPKSKKIHRIELDAKSDNYSKSAQIIFDNEGISIDLDVNGGDFLRLRDNLLDIIAGTRPWYSVIPRSALFYDLIFGFLFGVTASLDFNQHLGILENSGERTEFVVRLIALFSIAVIGFFVLLLIRHCFPQGVFLIGQEKSRFKHLKWAHGIIISSIITLVLFLIRVIIQKN